MWWHFLSLLAIFCHLKLKKMDEDDDEDDEDDDELPSKCNGVSLKMQMAANSGVNLIAFTPAKRFCYSTLLHL